MLEFKEITFEDRNEIERRLKISDFRGCQYTFACQYIYRIYYRTKVAFFEDFVLFRSEAENKLLYLYPAGAGNVEAVINEIISDAKQNNKDFIISGIDGETKLIMEEIFKSTIELVYYRDNCDYIYNSSDLIELAGKKYHSKRNHLKQFQNNDCCKFEPITSDTIQECNNIYDKWLSEKDGDYSIEISVIKECITHFSELNLVGGFIRGECGICAFTLGEPLNSDTFVIHIEKALTDCKGSSAAINNEFAKYACADYKYINREEDMGIEGLRKAKLSYKPEIILDDYTAFYKG